MDNTQNNCGKHTINEKSLIVSFLSQKNIFITLPVSFEKSSFLNTTFYARTTKRFLS
jgi:hypothetical protein